MGACWTASGEVCVPSSAALASSAPTRPSPRRAALAALDRSRHTVIYLPDPPWGWIVDGCRWAIKTPSWTSPAAALADLVENYRRDRGTISPSTSRVWTEKHVITSVVAPTTLGLYITRTGPAMGKNSGAGFRWLDAAFGATRASVMRSCSLPGYFHSHHDGPMFRAAPAGEGIAGSYYFGGWLVSRTRQARSVEAMVLPPSFTVIEPTKISRRGGRG